MHVEGCLLFMHSWSIVSILLFPAAMIIDSPANIHHFSSPSHFRPQQSNDATKGPVCVPFRDDYFECLHHNKEHDMVRAVMEQQKKNEELVKSGGESEH